MPYTIDLSQEELEDLMTNLDQCESEGYIQYGSLTYKLMRRIENLILEKEKSEK